MQNQLAVTAECDQLLFGVVAGVAAKVFVIDLILPPLGVQRLLSIKNNRRGNFGLRGNAVSDDQDAMGIAGILMQSPTRRLILDVHLVRESG